MKHVIVAAVAAFIFATTAQAGAGNPSLCSQGGWATAQSSSGQSFASMKDCAKAREVFKPTLSISPTHVGALERFDVIATGFHADATSIIYFAITGQEPYGTYTPFYPIGADGNFTIPMTFLSCGNSPDDLTLTFVDSFGVHASARLILC